MLKLNNTLGAHSKAKIDLYRRYLAIYLRILVRNKYIKNINISEFFCGEGIYGEDEKGSAALAIDEVVLLLAESNAKLLPNIKLWFNDSGISDLDDCYKVDRVEEYYKSKINHLKVSARFDKKSYQELYLDIIDLTGDNNGTKNLLFIDPYGYKEIDLYHLKDFLRNLNTEILLFIPINSMYRFLTPVLSGKTFAGDEALKNMMEILEIKNKDKIKDEYDFINEIKVSFNNFFDSREREFFVDTFTLETGEKNIYSLFFITPNIAGFEKMLESKWQLDKDEGRGFRLDNGQLSLFEPENRIKYERDLKDFLKSKDTVTNGDIFYFGLKKGFLPKHTNKVLKKWKNAGEKFYFCDRLDNKVDSFLIKRENYGLNPKKVIYFKYC